MTFILLSIIKLYWFLKPKSWNGKCIYKKSCSQKVFETTKEQGFIKGLKILKYRFKNCRAGYHFLKINDSWIICTVDNKIINQQEIAPHLLNETKL